MNMATKQSTPFSTRESEILTLAFQCIEERPKVRYISVTYLVLPLTDHRIQINFELMASKGGFKDNHSARNQFNKLYSKIVNGEKSSASKGEGEGEEKSGEPSPRRRQLRVSARLVCLVWRRTE